MDTENTQKLAGESQNNNNYSNNNLIRERIDGTPFDIIGNENEGYFISMGKYRISGLYSRNIGETLQELGQGILLNEQWNIITNTIVILHTLTPEMINELTKEETENI